MGARSRTPRDGVERVRRCTAREIDAVEEVLDFLALGVAVDGCLDMVKEVGRLDEKLHPECDEPPECFRPRPLMEIGLLLSGLRWRYLADPQHPTRSPSTYGVSQVREGLSI